MTLRRAASWLLAQRECKVPKACFDGRATHAIGYGARSASPQPVELEGALQSLQAQARQGETSTSGRPFGAQQLWERFMYTLYKVRGEEPLESRKRIPRRHKDMHDDLLLPLRVRAFLGKEGSTKSWLNLYYKELQIELGAMRNMQEKVVRAVEKTMKRGAGADLSSSKNLMSHWMLPLTEAIEDEQKLILNGVTSVDRLRFGPYLLLLPAHVLASATLHGFITTMLMAPQMGIAKVVQQCMSIGKNVQQQVELDMMKTKAQRVNRQRLMLRKRIQLGEAEALSNESDWTPDWFQGLSHNLLDPAKNPDEDNLRKELMARFKELKPFEVPDPAKSQPGMSLGSSMVAGATGSEDLQLLSGTQSVLRRTMRRNAKLSNRVKTKKLNENLNRAREASRTWQTDKLIKLGARLLEMLMKHCLVTEIDPVTGGKVDRPAMERYTVQLRDRKQGFIRLHDGVTRQLNRLKDVKALLLPAYQPMVIPPLPWQGTDFGGYLIARSHVMRFRFSKPQRNVLDEADKRSGLQKVYDALNALGETGWRIDKEMLSIISHVADAELDICGMPRTRDLPIIDASKQPRFRLTGGGFWRSSARHSSDLESSSDLEDLEIAGSSRADWPLVSPSSRSGAVMAGEGVESGAENSEAVVRKFSELEGDQISPLKPTRKGHFCRTQLLATFSRDETELERRLRRIKNSAIRKANREQYSLRCDLKLKLEASNHFLKFLWMTAKSKVARQFMNERAIYFPHNLDFRGRAYPMHPHLNHLGNDLCRGLLEFAEGKPLARNGLSWLYVQLANTWGQGEDKKSFEGRQNFVRSNLENISRSAREPLEFGWWQNAEEPWQFLAACKDVDRALSSGNPESYVSHKPVMMDGSCNGLQHYAALSLDYPGGAAVNLTPAAKPQDVYTQVVGLVRESVGKDAAEGHPIASLLHDQIDRKLVKQTVMTSVYGVTFVGARDQIKSRLRERGWESGTRFDNFEVANYAAKQTLAGLHLRFKEAKLVMEWLTDCARAITSTGSSVTWTTPLGLPVVQPYKKLVNRDVRTVLQRIAIQGDKPEQQPIQRLRQRSAFPPNFIHSIDSTHMMMTATVCRDEGLSFAGVHDSYWTHAADTERLGRILREQFVELYRRPILEDLAAQFAAEYPQVTFPPLPPKGDLHIEDVLDAPYFFS